MADTHLAYDKKTARTKFPAFGHARTHRGRKEHASASSLLSGVST